MSDLYQQFDEKLAEIKAYIQDLKDKAAAGDAHAELRLLGAQFYLAQRYGRSPPGWKEIHDSQGHPTGNFVEMR